LVREAVRLGAQDNCYVILPILLTLNALFPYG